jgi:hypothetical protein
VATSEAGAGAAAASSGLGGAEVGCAKLGLAGDCDVGETSSGAALSPEAVGDGVAGVVIGIAPAAANAPWAAGSAGESLGEVLFGAAAPVFAGGPSSDPLLVLRLAEGRRTIRTAGVDAALVPGDVPACDWEEAGWVPPDEDTLAAGGEPGSDEATAADCPVVLETTGADGASWALAEPRAAARLPWNASVWKFSVAFIVPDDKVAPVSACARHWANVEADCSRRDAKPPFSPPAGEVPDKATALLRINGTATASTVIFSESSRGSTSQRVVTQIPGHPPRYSMALFSRRF